jgi:hypothetical protein
VKSVFGLRWFVLNKLLDRPPATFEPEELHVDHVADRPMPFVTNVASSRRRMNFR